MNNTVFFVLIKSKANKDIVFKFFNQTYEVKDYIECLHETNKLPQGCVAEFVSRVEKSIDLSEGYTISFTEIKAKDEKTLEEFISETKKEDNEILESLTLGEHFNFDDLEVTCPVKFTL